MDLNCSVKPKLKPDKRFFKSQYFWKPFIGIVIGGLAGFLYYYFIGCKSGTCAITSNPWNSTIMGGFLGFWIAGSTCTRFRQLL
jgi:LytS/YehU family sensor histidine kinase